jgi:hypothetical protein
MLYATFTEYQTAKNEIIGNVEFWEDSIFLKQYGMCSKTYSTENNGNFFEVADPRTGITEFWSTKDSKSRYYDGRLKDKAAFYKVPGENAVRRGEVDRLGWTVYLTKSQQAAYAIAHGYGCDMFSDKNGVKAVKCGEADGEDGKRLIPSMYHGKGYFYAAAAVENSDGTDEKRHQVIIC